MIRASRPADAAGVARHYDELDPFYRALWGEHLHHGWWATGRERPEEAALALVDQVVSRGRLRAGHRVCDVGCGYGAVARELAGRGMDVVGLTLSPAQHAHAVARGTAGDPDSGSVRFLLRDWAESGLEDGAFDRVLAVESLSHMADPGAALAEAHRVLRPGGIMVACVWLAAPDPRPWQVRHILRPVCDEGRLPGLPAAADYRRWLTEAGFVDGAVEDVSHRVARTWRVCAARVGRAVLRPSSWRYLLDRRNTERSFALSVLRLLVGYRTGAMRYGILVARRPPAPPAPSGLRGERGEAIVGRDDEATTGGGMDGRTLLKRLRDEDWYLGDTEGPCRQYIHPEQEGFITVCVRHTEQLGPAAAEHVFQPGLRDVEGTPEVVVEETETGASAYAPELAGCVATGRDADEARARMDEALALHRQRLREDAA